MPNKTNGKASKTTAREKTAGTERRKIQPSEKNQPTAPPPQQLAATRKTGWTFLTNHAHVIILLTRQPDMVLREVASEIGITERAVQRIIADLEEDGFLIREKIGRQNHYRVVHHLPLRHPIEQHRRIGDLVDLILKNQD